MIIRKAKLNDSSEIAQMYNELREHELALLPKHMKNIQLNWERKKTSKDIAGIISSKKACIFVAESDSKLVGFANGSISRGIKNLEGEIDLYVRKSGRGVGVGTKLILAVKTWFKTKKCKSMSISVYSANPRAKKLYEKLGFTELICMLKQKL